MTDGRSVRVLPRMAGKEPGFPPGFVPAGGFDDARMVDYPALRLVVLRHLSRWFTRMDLSDRVPRLLLVQGRPGIGKTQTVRKVVSDAGVDLIVGSGSEFAGEHENAAVDVWNRLETSVKEVTARTGRKLAILLTDFDRSNIGVRKGAECTIDSQLHEQHVMLLADDTSRLTMADGAPVPIVMDGNSFVNFNAAVVREGRCEIFTHEVSFEDKCRVVASIFGIKDKSAVKRLVWLHRDKEVSFFRSLRARIRDADLDRAITLHGSDWEAIGKALGAVEERIDIARVRVAADEAAQLHVEDFMKKGR